MQPNWLTLVGSCKNGMKGKRSILASMKVAIFAFLFTCLSMNAFAVPLSNELPKELVKVILEDGLWENSFDQPQSAEAQDLLWFWNESKNGRAEIPVIVDQLFGAQASSRGEVRLPRLYPVKIHMLRYLRFSNMPRVQAISDAWTRRYLEMATSTLDLTNVEEIKQITERFRQRLRSRDFRIVDLSPEERVSLSSAVGSLHHGTQLNAREGRRYLVAGAYSEEKKIFALDFARPLEETLVTFAHEMVHAADPALEEHRRIYRENFAKVIAVLAKWMNYPDGNAIAIDIVDHVFFETGLQNFTDIMQEVRAKRAEQLKKNIALPPVEGEKVFEPTNEELAIVQTWMRAAIGLTVENEYRAYGYSVLAYGLLKSRLQILPPSIDRQRFVERFLAGDGMVAAQLSVSMNPFLRARSDLFQKFFKAVPRSGDNKERFPLIRIGKILDQLELTYIEETEKFLRTVNNRISSILKKLSSQDMMPTSVLPDWAQSDGFDLPSNPFQVLTVRLTTAWALRFRQNIDLFVQDVQEINKPLQTMRWGILDLSDTTVGERKLIGVNYENSPWASQPKRVNPKLALDLDAIPVDIAKYFALAKWNPETVASSEAIDGKVVAQNLVRLRTVKATAWLDHTFPRVRSTMLGMRSFLQRLRDGIYNADELSAERAKELEQELILSMKQSSEGVNDLILMRELLSELHLLYQAAQDSQWVGVASLLQEKIRFVVQSLDFMGVQATVTVKDLQEKIKKDGQAFYTQLETPAKRCQDLSKNDRYRIGGFWPETGFSIGSIQFPLSMICYYGKLYLVRQPDDFTDFMTTQIRNGAPEARIFHGSRPVRLNPVNLGVE